MNEDMMAEDNDHESEEELTGSGASSIGVRVPRVQLDNAIEVLEKAYQHGRSPSITQVAAVLDQKLSSGAFRTRMAGAAHYGLLSPERGRVQITDLGMRVLDHEQRPAALVDAWMNVPVFKALFNRFDGSPLPPESGIEAELRNLGVPSKNVALARRVMMKSADTAGLLTPARDRLVQPTLGTAPAKQQSAEEGGNASREPRSTDAKPIELDFGDAGRVKVIVEIDWLALKSEVFGELRTAVERLKELAALQCQPEGQARPMETPIPHGDETTSDL